MTILNKIFVPNISISEEVGFSGKNIWFKKYGSFLTISKGEKQTTCLGINMTINLSDNWCRDISHGGTTLGIGKYNYWIGDKCLVGKLIKPLFI